MKKAIATFLAAFILLLGTGIAQDFTVTNKYVLSNTVEVVNTISLDLIPVVTGAGLPFSTNASFWGPWIPEYIDACIYTNGLTTSNVINESSLGRANRQIRNIYQGTSPQWNGKYTVDVELAKYRIKVNEKLHCLISFQDNATSLTNLVGNTNIIYAVNGLMYKVINIPNNKPAWLP